MRDPKNTKLKLVNGSMIEYELLKIHDEYDTILQNPTKHWDFSNPPFDIKYLTFSMIETMLKNHGLGLSANQVGIPYRIFVMGTGQFVEAIINPLVLEMDEITEESIEGCLSYPGLFLRIPRPKSIKVEYFDWSGNVKRNKFEGMTARVFLHEYDHLDGVRFTDRVSNTALMIAKNKIKSNLRKMKKNKVNQKDIIRNKITTGKSLINL